VYQLGKASFDSAPLNEDQERSLIQLMHQVRKTPSDLPDMTNPSAMAGVNVDDAFVAKQMRRIDQDGEAVMSGAGSFLSPQQMEALKLMLAQQRNLTAAGIKMAREMMN
jgi:hypothetical protein